MIVEDGYNLGRDWLVERAEAGTHFKGIWWKAEVEWREGLLEPGHQGAFFHPTPSALDVLFSAGYVLVIRIYTYSATNSNVATVWHYVI